MDSDKTFAALTFGLAVLRGSARPAPRKISDYVSRMTQNRIQDLALCLFSPPHAPRNTT